METYLFACIVCCILIVGLALAYSYNVKDLPKPDAPNTKCCYDYTKLPNYSKVG